MPGGENYGINLISRLRDDEKTLRWGFQFFMASLFFLPVSNSVKKATLTVKHCLNFKASWWITHPSFNSYF